MNLSRVFLEHPHPILDVSGRTLWVVPHTDALPRHHGGNLGPQFLAGVLRRSKPLLHPVFERVPVHAVRVPGRVAAFVKRRLVVAVPRAELLAILEGCRPPPPSNVKPQVILIVGVNGVGKTTTIGKLAAFYHNQGSEVLICASDTFRAAAVEQLAIWSRRSGAEIIKQSAGADPAAVLFDALRAAEARKVDYLLADTAGRLHTKTDLMQELKKMKRIASREVEGAPHEVFLVVDATTGQNGLIQACEFLAAVGVSGLIVTKLDGTAKGGIVVAIARDLGIPIRFVGVGEQLGDLMPFSAEAFVTSLLSVSEEDSS